MLCDSLEGGNLEGVSQRKGHISMADSCWCMAETNTIFESNYLPIKNVEKVMFNFWMRWVIDFPIPFSSSWKWKSLSHVQLFSTPWIIQSMEFSRPEYWSELLSPSPGDLSNPGIEPRSPALQVDSLPAEPPGKPKNTGVCSLSLLQRISLTQESNWGLLHCRRVLYQLSYQGSSHILK